MKKGRNCTLNMSLEGTKYIALITKLENLIHSFDYSFIQ